jgi:hypothetical protein
MPLYGREIVAKMPRWDYKTVVLTGGFMGRHKEELKGVDLEKQFDELGADGWELVWVLMAMSPRLGRTASEGYPTACGV